MNRVINTKNIIALCLLVISLTLFTRCAEEFESPDPVTGATLVALADADSTLQIFSAALEKTGIGISLDNINSGQHTVFAPTDSAFRVYFQPIIGGGPGDAAIIAYINTLSPTTNPTLAAFTARLQYHVVSSEVLAANIANSQVFTTINAARLSLSKNGNNVWVNANAGANGTRVKTLDINGANGVIHTVKNFLTAISTASVVTNTLGITVNYATAPPTVTVGATAGNNYDLLSNAIKKAGLATTLRPNVPAALLPDFTVFAPDDAAMVTYLGTLSGGTVTDEATGITYINGLSGAPLTTLTNVLKYHVVTGRKLTTDLTLNEEVSTLLTGEIFIVKSLTPPITLEDTDEPTPGTATMTAANANTLTNAGVLHRLNGVLKPE